MSTHAISIQGLYKRYPGQEKAALNDLCLTIDSGTIFGLLGPNGAGKTTLITILCTLLQLDSGEISLLGTSIEKQEKIRRCIGLVPQEIALYPSLTARENLRYFAQIQRVKKADLEDRIEACLEMAGLKEHGNQKISQYSGGMKRRINLAVGILHNPKILFLDEPTVGIDPQSRTLIFDKVRQLNSEGMTVVYTTHYMDEAQQLCDRVAIMDKGRIIALDSPENLLQQNKNCSNLEELFLELTGKQLRD